jgi:hypothetical protein
MHGQRSWKGTLHALDSDSEEEDPESTELCAELSSFVSLGDCDTDRGSRLRFFEDVLRIQEERLHILRRYHCNIFNLSTSEQAFTLADKLDSIFSFEQLFYFFDDKEVPAATRSTAPRSAVVPELHKYAKRGSAIKILHRFERFLQDLKNEQREQRIRTALQHDQLYRALQERIGAIDVSQRRTKVWSLRTCCAFAILDHRLDERSDYSSMLPTELHDYVNAIAFLRKFLRVRWTSTSICWAARTTDQRGATALRLSNSHEAVDAGDGLERLVSGEAQGEWEESGNEERRISEIASTFELEPEGIAFTVRHLVPRDDRAEEMITISCFGEEFIECRPGHSKGTNPLSPGKWRKRV